jgi:hypothetical protein
MKKSQDFENLASFLQANRPSLDYLSLVYFID